MLGRGIRRDWLVEMLGRGIRRDWLVGMLGEGIRRDWLVGRLVGRLREGGRGSINVLMLVDRILDWTGE
jgi:hypothetical protein